MNGLSSITGINGTDRVFQTPSVLERENRKVAEQEKVSAPKDVLSGDVRAVSGSAADDEAHPDPDSVTVSRSADGDTTRASRAALDSLRDGMVFRKGEAVEGRVREKEQPGTVKGLKEAFSVTETGDDSAKDRPITSMTGYTDTQVDQLYRQGRISRQDYDKEMERREKIDEAAGVEKKENPVIDSAKEASAKEVIEEQSEKLREQDRRDTKAGEDAAASRREQDEKAQEKKQLITEEIENNEEFINTMGQVSAQKQDFSLRAEAVMDSLAAGREELMEQVMEAAEKVSATEPTQ